MKKIYVILIIIGMLLLTTIVCSGSNDKRHVDMTFYEVEKHFFGPSWPTLYRYRRCGIQTPSLEFLKHMYSFET